MIDCDIILTVYNGIEMTQRCLDSVVRHFRPQDRLVIIDNGSDNETRDYLRAFVSSRDAFAVDLVRFDENKGFLQAANAGLRRSTRRAACLLSNDTVVTAGWLQRMCDVMEKNPRIGVVNPMSTTFGMFPKKANDVDECGRDAAERYAGMYKESASCVGFCMAIRREVIAAVGYLDEAYADGYFEDTDFCRRAVTKGFTCAIALDAYVWHREHATFGNKQREALFVKNRALFESRWGRPRRYLYAAASNRVDRQVLIDESLASARQGNWIWLVVANDEKNKFSPVLIHGNIRLIGVSRYAMWFYPWFLNAVRRKKPFDAVVLK